jgi:hypothetical protein
MKTGNPAAVRALATGDIENFLVAATPGGIEAQEKRGQMALVASSDMPKEMWPNREAFEKVGFKFGDNIDNLFVEATLPTGWKRAPTDHSMHSKIVDEQDRERVSIFYKAAFYDRRADARLVKRFTISNQYPDLPGGEGLGKDQIRVAVLDCGNVIHQMPATGRREWDAAKQSQKDAIAWLAERHPEHSDPTVGW